MEPRDVQKDVLRRLNILISLELDRQQDTKISSIASKVHRLIALGLAPSEVANIIGKPVNYVTALLATKRARARRRTKI